MRTVVRIGLAVVFVVGSLVLPGTGTTQRARASDTLLTSVWTQDSYQNVFADDVAPAGALTGLSLVAARNEFESGQILIRKTQPFQIRQVRFDDLRGSGGAVVPAANLDYRFVEFEHLRANSTFAGSQPVINPIRKAPGEFPDALSNERSVAVPANSTQPIRIRAYVPRATVPGSYRGTATVVTDRGESVVPISLSVAGATVPDAAASSFTTDLWMLQYGSLSWDEGAGDTIELFYGHKRLSPQWWALMGEFAKSMKENRHNNLPVNMLQLLIGGGSTVGADGTYTFDWSLFDRFVSFFHDRGVVKRLEGFWMAGPNIKGHPYPRVEIIDRDAAGKPIREYADWDGPKATNFIDQFVPALRDHVKAKGWADEWWMHVGDEPHGAENLRMHAGLAERYRSHWPEVQLSDAVVDWGGAQAVAPAQSFLIPNEWTLNEHEEFYAQQRAAGKQVWLYNCNVPTWNYLNRFIDQPVWHQRSTMWYAYSRDLTGYLHWAFNNWQYKMADQEVRGDGWITKPDKKNNKLKYTIRLESLRDGLEDRELLELVGKRDPGLAKDLAAAVVTTANRYSRDPAYLARIRELLVRAASGDDITGWQPAADPKQADLGRQTQVDAVRLRWNGEHPASYTIETSYDGEHWAEAHRRDKADGGLDLAGLNAKARYVRVVADGAAPAELAVSGTALARPNLAGGKTYARSAEPVAAYPDTGGRESTDGLQAAHYADARSHGYELAAGGTTTVELTVDLGTAQPVDQVRIHRYGEYERFRYGPDSVTVAVSADGTAYRQKARLTQADGSWYDATFPVTQARYLKVSFGKQHAAEADTLFLDEIEAYGPAAAELVNVAEGKQYAKSAAPDDPFYPDTADKESTDGEIGGDLTDPRSYAYYLDPGQSRTVAVTVDLGGPKSVNQVRIRQYADGFHHYDPDRVTVYVKPVGGDFRPVGQVAWATAGWYDVGFGDTVVTAVRVELTKREGRHADYLFVDEIAAIGDRTKSPANLVAGSAYTATTDSLDPAYPDSTGKESTDGVLAGHYSDGKSWAYVMQPDQTLTADIDFDLGSAKTLSLARFREYSDGVHNYRPDKVVVLVSADGTTWTEKAIVTQASGRWYEAVLGDVQARYVRFRAVKTYGYFAEYIFVDELEVYGR